MKMDFSPSGTQNFSLSHARVIVEKSIFIQWRHSFKFRKFLDNFPERSTIMKA